MGGVSERPRLLPAAVFAADANLQLLLRILRRAVAAAAGRHLIRSLSPFRRAHLNQPSDPLAVDGLKGVALENVGGDVAREDRGDVVAAETEA